MPAPFKPRWTFTFCLLVGLFTQPSAVRLPSAKLGPEVVCPITSVQTLIDAAPGGGSITLPACTFSESLLIDKDLTLIGDSTGITILQAPANQRIILFTGNHTLNLQKLVLSGGNAGISNPNYGGAIYAPAGSLRISNSTIRSSSAYSGGGIYQGSITGTVVITDSVIENNQATFEGGGINAAGSVTLTNTTVSGNTARVNGGGLLVLTGSTTIQGGSFSDNTATEGNSGAVDVNNGLTISGTQFNHNSAGGSGGAVTQWNPGYPVAISNATFHANTSKLRGGGAFINSVLTLDHVIFDSNIVNSGSSINSSGGGVNAGNSGKLTAAPALIVKDSTFTGNQAKCLSCAAPSGGGLYFDTPAGTSGTPTALISASSFEANQAGFGGGAYGKNNKFIVDHSTFINNSAGSGGGMNAYQLQGEALVFQGNSAANSGGGIDAFDLDVRQSRFLNNTATASGGSAINARNTADLANILVVPSTANPGNALRLSSNATGGFNNITVSQPTQGSGTGVYVASNANLHVRNSIFTNFAIGIDVNGTLNYDHDLFFSNTTDVKGTNITDGGSNLQQDPLFIDPAGGDYHLQPASPAIAGGTYTSGIDVDLDYAPRLPERSAMGAYNFGYWAYLPVIAN